MLDILYKSQSRFPTKFIFTSWIVEFLSNNKGFIWCYENQKQTFYIRLLIYILFWHSKISFTYEYVRIIKDMRSQTICLISIIIHQWNNRIDQFFESKWLIMFDILSYVLSKCQLYQFSEVAMSCRKKIVCSLQIIRQIFSWFVNFFYV